MKRLTLAGQVALIVAGAIFLAQIFNLSLAVEHRRELALSEAVGPAANRLAFAYESPDVFDRRDARRAWRRAHPGMRDDDRPALRRDRALRVRLHPSDPIAPGAERLPELERLLVERLIANEISDPAVHVVAIGRNRHGGDRRREDLLFALRLDDGRWASVRAPGPPSARPLVLMLTLQSLVIGLMILLPTLWLLRRVGGSLARLEQAAREFDGTAAAPVPATGPRDVAGLIAAVNAMQSRIATMIDEKDVMLGAIGHDLRTPLAALRIEAENVDDPERRDALVAQIERLHGQFEAILELARSSRPLAPGQEIDPGRLFDRLEEAYRGRPVTFDRAADAPFAGDPVAIERALANLVDNALRFGRSVDVRLSADRDVITIRVQDDGPGIAEPDRASMIRPFARGEASRNRATGGHGLGLAIVDAIARRHRGRLELGERADGAQGLVARLVFPHLPAAAATLH